MSTPRPTPETDALQKLQTGLLCGGANLEFARNLERQRDELRESEERIRRELVQALKEADELRRALARLIPYIEDLEFPIGADALKQAQAALLNTSPAPDWTLQTR